MTAILLPDIPLWMEMGTGVSINPQGLKLVANLALHRSQGSILLQHLKKRKVITEADQQEAELYQARTMIQKKDAKIQELLWRLQEQEPPVKVRM